jgi:glycine/D-amino acid oxidase-like deaminating enzyme
MEFEHLHVEEKLGVIEESGIKADQRRVEGLDVYHDEKTWGRAVDAVEDIRKHDSKLGARYTIYRTRGELRALGVSDLAVGAIGMPAATMWPYKFVTGLLEKFVKEKGLSIQTNTVVKSVYEEPNGKFATVRTDRGNIKAKHVVHATNAYLGHLVTELRPYISPVRANVQRQLPRPSTLKLTRSYWLRYGEKDYDYMMQRPDGATIIGRGSTGRRATADDSQTDLVAHVHLRGATPFVFDWGTDKVEVTHIWSGAVAFTQDGNAFVGRIPFSNKKHQWVCGGYGGIGMVRAFKSAQGLAHLILGEDLPPEFPRSQLVSETRLDSL